MDAIAASALLAGAAALAGEMVDPATGTFTPDADTLARFTARLTVRLPKVWNANRWPEVTPVRQWRLFNAPWFTDGIGLPQREWKVIDREGNRVYLCLATPVSSPSLGLVVPPLTDATRWLPLAPEYPEAVEWSPSVDYEAGTVVRYQAKNSSGAWYEGLYVAAINPLVGSPPPSPASEFEIVSNQWIRVDTLSLLFQKPSGVGDILDVHPMDPRVYRCDPLTYELRDGGILVCGYPASAWFTYRLAPPVLHGAPLDTSASYAVGAQVYWQSGTVGDFYTVKTATVPGETPATSALKFTKIEIPRLFAQYLIAAVSADWLRWDGQVEKSSDQEAAAATELDRLHDNFVRQQKQQHKLPVRTRPR